MSNANKCETCDGRASWTITREGDVVTTWACPQHLARACLGLQRVRETRLFVMLNEHHPD